MRRVHIGKSKIAGKGVFAEESIRKGDFLFNIEGPIVKWLVKDTKTSWAFPNWVGYDSNRWIDVQGPIVYMNHSCSPNVGIKGARRVYALKDIPAGEELTMDYSITEGDALWQMQCNCEARGCRKIIRSVQYLPAGTYKKYLPYIPTYFQKVFKNNRQPNAKSVV